LSRALEKIKRTRAFLYGMICAGETVVPSEQEGC
jgi:hypothetical protein